MGALEKGIVSKNFVIFQENSRRLEELHYDFCDLYSLPIITRL